MKYLSKIAAVGLASVLLSGCIAKYETCPETYQSKPVVITKAYHSHRPIIIVHKHFVPHQRHRHAKMIVTKAAKSHPRVVVTKHKKVKKEEQQSKVVLITKHF